MNRLFSLLLLTLPLPALAWDASVGVLAGTAIDMPDRVSSGSTRFNPGGSLAIPIRYRIGEAAFLRAAVRLDAATGHDQVTWNAAAGDRMLRMSSRDHWSLLGAAALTVGGEVRVPAEWAVLPYGGASIGGTWVGTWHSFGVSDSGVDTRMLIDPAQNDLNDGNNIDPWASGFAILAEVHLGAAVPLSDTVELQVETGYSMAYLPEADLRKATPGLDARRSAFGWNPVRIQAGIAFTF
ncbi:MAG: hypothetical protein EA397_08045 [Deltaproteobacteria bacterium]|nr:MAG: hypothetical protein EA397_08045 [Deltaproteobacteria bacterium]